MMTEEVLNLGHVRRDLLQAYVTYNSMAEIDKFVTIKKSDATDGSYRQIGVAWRLNKDQLIAENVDNSVVFGDAGRIVALGELRFLFDVIENNCPNIDVHKSLTHKLFMKQLYRALSKNPSAENIHIIVPIDVKYRLFLTDPIWRVSYDIKMKEFVMNIGSAKIPVLSYSKDVLRNRIIILNYPVGEWNYLSKERFDNKEETPIFIKLEDYMDGDVKLLVKTTAKLSPNKDSAIILTNVPNVPEID